MAKRSTLNSEITTGDAHDELVAPGLRDSILKLDGFDQVADSFNCHIVWSIKQNPSSLPELSAPPAVGNVSNECLPISVRCDNHHSDSVGCRQYRAIGRAARKPLANYFNGVTPLLKQFTK